MNSVKELGKICFGYSELKEIRRFENGRMVTYGYRVDYDRRGREIRRTEPSFCGSIGWSDGSPFTEDDLRDLSTSRY